MFKRIIAVVLLLLCTMRTPRCLTTTESCC